MLEVSAIPEGFTAITPHLTVNDANAAIKFYGDAFGAVVVGRMDSPDGKVIHATIAIGGAMVMLNDEFPDMGCVSAKALGGSPVAIHLYVEDVDATMAAAVAAGAVVTMPAADMFWGDRYGKIIDPFGHSWSLARHVADPSVEDMQAAVEGYFGSRV